MFKVKDKCTDEVFTVYDVKRRRSSESGFDELIDIEFLIYTNDKYDDIYEWTYVNAAHYEPVSE